MRRSGGHEGLGGVGNAQRHAALHEGGTQVGTGRLLTLEGVVDRALVRRHPAGDRDRDRPQVAGELHGREHTLPVPVGVELAEVDRLLDQRGVDLHQQVATDLVGPQSIRRLAHEEQDGIQIVEVAIGELLVEALLGAHEHPLELGEDLLPRGTGRRCHDFFSLFRHHRGAVTRQKDTRTRPFGQGTLLRAELGLDWS